MNFSPDIKLGSRL